MAICWPNSRKRFIWPGTRPLTACRLMVNGAWVSLETEEAIDEHVVDTAALIPPYKVLGLIHKEVVAVNFGFLGLRKKPNVPRRFRSGITPDTVDLIHPIIANLIASGKASMAELDSVYPVSDAVFMADVLVVDSVNQAKAQEAAIAEAKAKGR